MMLHSVMAGTLSQPGVDHDPWYSRTKMRIFSDRIGSMESFTVRVVNTILHAAVFQIIGVLTQGKDEYI